MNVSYKPQKISPKSKVGWTAKRNRNMWRMSVSVYITCLWCRFCFSCWLEHRAHAPAREDSWRLRASSVYRWRHQTATDWANHGSGGEQGLWSEGGGQGELGKRRFGATCFVLRGERGDGSAIDHQRVVFYFYQSWYILSSLPIINPVGKEKIHVFVIEALFFFPCFFFKFHC